MTKFFNIFKKPCFWPIFPIFGAKTIFLEMLALSRTTSYGFLASCQNLEKTNKNAQTNGRTDGLPANAGGPMTTTIIIHNNNKKIHLICILQSQTCQEDRRTKKNFCEKDLFLGILKTLLPARILTFVGRNCD